MAEKGMHSLREINNQPAAWFETIRVVEEKTDRLIELFEGIEELIVTGCGSAFNISQTVAPTIQSFTGIRACAVPAAEISFYPESVFSAKRRTLVVLFSRSGDTSETVRACQVAKERGLRTLSITCYLESQLARLSDDVLVLTEASEQSVITTQSLTSMVLCGQVISAIFAGDTNYLHQLKQLPELGPQVVAEASSLGREIGDNEKILKYAFVGNGPFYGLSKECQLKIKETVLLPSDSYPLFDYRHGPKSNVDEHMLIAVLLSDSARAEEITFIDDMKQLGGKLLVLCDRADDQIRSKADYLFESKSDLPDFARGILYLPVIHFLACRRATARGYDPDNPVNLTHWVELT